MKSLFFAVFLLLIVSAVFAQNKHKQNIQLGPMQTIWEMSDQNGNLPDWFSTTETNVRAIEHSLSETIAHLYVLVYEDGQPHIKILDARTGTFIKELSMLGVSGGLLPLNRLLSVGGEKLLACNLTEKASDNPFKIYYWENGDSDPTVIITENDSDLTLGYSLSRYFNWDYFYSFIVPASNSNIMLKFDSDQLYNFTKTTINLEGEPLGDAPSSVCMNVWDYYGYYVMINSYGDSSRYYSINGDIYCTIPSNILPLNSSSLDAYWDGGTLCCDFPAVFASLPENNTIKAIQSWGWYDPQNFEQNGYFSDFSPSLGNNPNPELLSDVTYRFYGPVRDTLYIFSLFGNNGLACYWWIGAAAPVELNYFTASVNGNNVKLRWETATETNNKGFYVERKYQSNNDDNVWTEIGFIEGAGTTSEKQTYSFIDRGLQPGKYLYRLKQIDTDGSYEFLKEIEAVIDLPQSFALGQNYPNPFGKNQNDFREITTIPYSLKEEAFVKLEIFNLVGERIETLINRYQPAGFYEVSFNGTQLSSGIYYYKLSVNEKYIAKKMILWK